MTPQEIALVRTSFTKLGPIAEQISALFYARLFELDPALRLLFHGDMRAQGRKLMSMIGTAVSLLDEPDTLLPMLRQLSSRHVVYGVRHEHYTVVGEVLLWTLQKGLGPEFTPEVAGAWKKTYTTLADTMRGAVTFHQAVA